jgi:hypothetical protein
MFIECRHIKPSGLKCKSPAVRNTPFCYFHTSLDRSRNPSASNNKEPLHLPSLEDATGVQLALQEILNALGSSRIDPQRAGIYLRGLQIAMSLAAKPEPDSRTQSVRILTCDEQGNPLAPEETRCEPPQDCPACEGRDRCQMYFFSRLKAEALKAEVEEPEDAQD